MGKSMLKEKGLRNDYWAEAVNIAIYILNRSPIKAVMNKTPYEAWYKQKPHVHILKVFGCIAYELIPAQDREKLYGKGEKYISIGYSDESKGHCLFDRKRSQLIISRDVTFDESACDMEFGSSPK